MSQTEEENLQAQKAWNTNAEFWDERMGEGNDFFNVLVWPTVEKLLQPVAGDLLLDIACGNGLTSRRLAKSGASVTAFDFSDALITLARERGANTNIDYRVIDATDHPALLELGVEFFDGALCNMALMDLADIDPLMQAIPLLLKQGGRFVFSVMHPCFNNPATVQVDELEDRAGTLVSTHSVKVSRYLTPFTQEGLAMRGQPVPHPYFHRPLSALLGPAFQAGLVLDALEERSFPPETVVRDRITWDGRFHEIPPALVGRLKKEAG